ncbi:unnamed protein product [Symbiodinium sp. CCMP2592]|nr:unnamed protein product [Symbiodinium sp. CCMP2592]
MIKAFRASRHQPEQKIRYRELRKRARVRKRQQILDILHLAEDAAARHDTRTQYRFIRMLPPKSFRRRICLRSPGGGLMILTEEADALLQYARDLFRGKLWDAPALLLLNPEWFRADCWKRAFRQLANHKAVADSEGTVEAWKQVVDQVSSALEQISLDSVANACPSIPQEWTRTQLAWLPKPGRATSSPSGLHTIGLLGPDSKAFLYILKEHANPYVQQAMAPYPQFAYRQHTSTVDALLRASDHCQQIRQLLDAQVDDITARILRRAPADLTGGIMASIDLSKAFDSLSHEEILCSLRETHMPEELARMILHVHISTTVTIKHKGCEPSFKMGRGLRQGCPIAPMVYAAWTARLCRKLDAVIRDSWSQQHLTIFADDKHSCWPVHSEQELNRALTELGLLIETIESCGMTVNLGKSSVVIAMKGRQWVRIQNQKIRMWNEKRCILVPLRDRSLYMPVEDHMIYLGTKLSYHRFEAQTVQYRAQQELGKVLRVNGPLNTGRRLQVYRTCVVPTILYELTGVGITGATMKVLTSTMAMQLRKVCSRIHEHGVSNQAVLSRAGLNLNEILLGRMRKQQTAITLDHSRSNQLRARALDRTTFLIRQLQHFQEAPIAAASSLIPDSLTLDQLHQRTLEAELRSPPQPPDDALFQELPYFETATTFPSVTSSVLKQHTQAIQKLTSKCSLSAVFLRPCSFCGSEARDTGAHSQQRSAVFQFLAVNLLKQAGHTLSSLRNAKPVQHKKSEAKPKYKSFVSPLATAFKAGADTIGRPANKSLDKAVLPLSSSETQTAHVVPRHDDQATRRLPIVHSGKITDFFTASRGAGNHNNMAQQVHWLCRLVLRNPHNICYANCSLIALMYMFDIAEQLPEPITFLRPTPADAQGSWQSEHIFVGAIVLLQIGNSRTDNGMQQRTFSLYYRHNPCWTVRLREAHRLPVGMRVEGDAPLQSIINRWHSAYGDADVQALIAAPDILCIQLGRSTDTGKNLSNITISDAVHLSVFAEGLQVDWFRYEVKSAVIHLGELMTSGHYRALLRVGSSWFYTDDNRRTTAPPSIEGEEDQHKWQCNGDNWATKPGTGGRAAWTRESSSWKRGRETEWAPNAPADLVLRFMQFQFARLWRSAMAPDVDAWSISSEVSGTSGVSGASDVTIRYDATDLTQVTASASDSDPPAPPANQQYSQQDLCRDALMACGLDYEPQLATALSSLSLHMEDVHKGFAVRDLRSQAGLMPQRPTKLITWLEYGLLSLLEIFPGEEAKRNAQEHSPICMGGGECQDISTAFCHHACSLIHDWLLKDADASFLEMQGFRLSGRVQTTKVRYCDDGPHATKMAMWMCYRSGLLCSPSSWFGKPSEAEGWQSPEWAHIVSADGVAAKLARRKRRETGHLRSDATCDEQGQESPALLRKLKLLLADGYFNQVVPNKTIQAGDHSAVSGFQRLHCSTDSTVDRQRVKAKTKPKAVQTPTSKLQVPSRSSSPSPRSRPVGTPTFPRSPSNASSPGRLERMQAQAASPSSSAASSPFRRIPAKRLPGTERTTPSPAVSASPRSSTSSPFQARPRGSPTRSSPGSSPRRFGGPLGRRPPGLLSDVSSEDGVMVDSPRQEMLLLQQEAVAKLKRQLADEQAKATRREEQVSSALAAAISSLRSNRPQAIASCERLEEENVSLKHRIPELDVQLERERGKSETMEEAMKELEMQVASLSRKCQLAEEDAARSESMRSQDAQRQEEVSEAVHLHTASLQMEIQLAREEALSLSRRRDELEKTWQQDVHRLQLQAEAFRQENMGVRQWDEAERRLLDEQHRCLELTENLKRLQQEGREELAAERRRMQTLREEHSQAAQAVAAERETSKHLAQQLQRYEQEKGTRNGHAEDGLRLLRSFEAWHRRTLQTMRERRLDVDQAKSQELHEAGRKLAVQEGKVKAAFGRATTAESDFASEMFTCQKLQQELRDLRHELDSEAIIHRSKAAAQEALLAAERTERQKLEERRLLDEQRCLELSEDVKCVQREGREELAAERRRMQTLREEHSQAAQAVAAERETSKHLAQQLQRYEQEKGTRNGHAEDGLRLLRSFEAWHRRTLQTMRERRLDVDQAKSQELHEAGRKLAVQEGKVKAAFGRATTAESDFASEMFTCQKLQQELRDLRHELDSEAIIHRSKAAAQEVLLAAERTERQKLEDRKKAYHSEKAKSRFNPQRPIMIMLLHLLLVSVVCMKV